MSAPTFSCEVASPCGHAVARRRPKYKTQRVRTSRRTRRKILEAHRRRAGHVNASRNPSRATGIVRAPESPASSNRRGSGHRMHRTVAVLGLLLLVAGCASHFDRSACYKSVRSPSGKNARALAVTPCPPEQRGVHRSAVSPMHASTILRDCGASWAHGGLARRDAQPSLSGLRSHPAPTTPLPLPRQSQECILIQVNDCGTMLIDGANSARRPAITVST
jgi:hypothetical protein